uniref:Uncharacterized protein n=1 Tax=Photinus pyralis TaxID=7054 RepID=A0A1Y1LAW3_PHOPY
MAPINGPIIKPNENAIPTRAIPIPLVLTDDASEIIAILRETLPLHRPPINRAIINKTKFFDRAQRMYESEIPTRQPIMTTFRPLTSDIPPKIGDAINWRKLNMDPKKPPNRTELY